MSMTRLDYDHPLGCGVTDRETEVIAAVLARRVGRPALVAGLAPIGLLGPQRAGVAPVVATARAPHLQSRLTKPVVAGSASCVALEPGLAVPHADLRIADAAAGDSAHTHQAIA